MRRWFSVSQTSRNRVEALYLELLDTLNAHFGHTPISWVQNPAGDFGLIAPLYAHLGEIPIRLDSCSNAQRLFFAGSRDEPPR